MFIWDLLTAFTNVLELIFGFLTGLLSLLATLATLNERLLLFVIDAFQTATDEVYILIEFLEKLFTCQLSYEDFDHYGLETVLETLNNICDPISYWFLRVFPQFLTPRPIGVYLAVVFAVLAVIHRRKWIGYLRYLLPNRLQISWFRHFVVWNRNNDREDDWNVIENLELDNDNHVLRAEILNGERDSTTGSDDLAAHTASTEVAADSHDESQLHSRGSRTCRESSRKNNEDRLLCVICQDKSKSVLVLPCRHLCMCESCAKVINFNAELPKICPLCRTAISRLVSVYV